MAFNLNSDLYKRITALESDLRAAADELRTDWDERTERWQESDAGGAADTWVEELHEVADTLDRVTPKPPKPVE